MQQFRTRKEGFDEIKKKLITNTTILFTIIFLVVILLPALLSNDPARFKTLPIMLPLFLAILVFSMMAGIKRQRSAFESFTLTIDDEKIVRERLNTPVLTIGRNEITKITKLANGSFCIEGKSKLNPIVIPAQMDNYQVMEDTLREVKPVTVLTSKTFAEKMALPISLSGVVLVGVIFLSKNGTVTLICSILIVAILLVSLVLTQMNKNVDKGTKRLSWMVLVPLGAFASIIIKKLLS